MIKKLRILPEAWEDIIKISSYYESISEELSLEFENLLFKSFENIRMFPEMYVVKYRNVRRKLTNKFPYAIYFYIDSTFIRIIAVVHQRENPKYIKSQIRNRRTPNNS